MRNSVIILFILCFAVSCKKSGVYEDGYIMYAPVQFTAEEKELIAESIAKTHEQYEPEFKMLARDIKDWNYHTDGFGHYHDVRSSFSYAVALLDLGDPQYKQRAFDLIDATIALQDTDTDSQSCGVWPYFLEEPLATKKSPIDYNWADFNVVSLLDIYMGHKDELPADLLKKVEKSIILGAKSVQKRNCGPGYTNIAIMGTYVTYVVSHLFNLPEMQEYAMARLKTFYDYTLEKNGFSEYNSPAYTITALDELERMKRHIIEPEAKKTIDALYTIAWEIIAKHYHQPTGQWAGPHSRSYSTPVFSSFYELLYQASDGKINPDIKSQRSNVKAKHRIPESLLPYFLTPKYPRVERDVFENQEPQITGTTYLTKQYAISSANRSSLWNQRRPFLVYWGTPQQPRYLQVRLLHDLYDLSTATYFGEQKDNIILSAINFATNGGDKHINIDIIKDGKIMAKDLRLRFEFGNVAVSDLALPSSENEPVDFSLDGLQFRLQLFYGVFGKYKGHWEKGGDETHAWLDYIFYSGNEKEIDFTTIDVAAFGYTFGVASKGEKIPENKVNYEVKQGILNAAWNGLKVNIPVKPDKKQEHL